MPKGDLKKFNRHISKVIKEFGDNKAQAMRYIMDATAEETIAADKRAELSALRAKITYEMFTAAQKANHVEPTGTGAALAGRVQRRTEFHDNTDNLITARRTESIAAYMERSASDLSELDRAIQIAEAPLAGAGIASTGDLNKVFITVEGTRHTVKDAKRVLQAAIPEEDRFNAIWRLMAPTNVGGAVINSEYTGVMLSSPHDEVVEYQVSIEGSGEILITFTANTNFNNTALMADKEVRPHLAREHLMGKIRTTVEIGPEFTDYTITSTFNPDGIRVKPPMRM